MSDIGGRRIILIIGGGIAAYKALELIRLLKKAGADLRVVMTRGAQEFVTPLAAGALAHGPVLTELFDRRAEEDIGHIRLARDADLVLLAPATASRMAKMAAGIADDLAGAVLLATDRPVLAAPAMNPNMWAHAATQRNFRRLAADGIRFVGPEAGEMAEAGEAGMGRMAEPEAILAAVEALFGAGFGPLAGRHVLVTSGPTHEPIDPVRYLANRSSGRQGHAIAAAFAAAGARVTLVSGPVALAPPAGVETVKVETARQMLEAVEAALPADIAIMAAAVADWRVAEEARQKMKKDGDGGLSLGLTQNPDILATLSRHARRPGLVVGFAAETENVVANARAKLARKGCDVILANDVSPSTGIMGGEENAVHFVTARGEEAWPRMGKDAVAARLVERAAALLAAKEARGEVATG
ncbi:bifunctional phosphopantothenoylcysteine decarboxylase/phosphopantothenate--cysteine ligase CoaBC [Afifella pfennigii]|uniref:bifunctional phosphopantothenoylcysteine decarboxylase/phosphopantothenate--cysteine ligase CoaBC n=1 Tax=Afifella pfennigii TaxID=209897 RepID=UPI003898F5FF